jgi:hypothetical protein
MVCHSSYSKSIQSIGEYHKQIVDDIVFGFIFLIFKLAIYAMCFWFIFIMIMTLIEIIFIISKKIAKLINNF